MLEYPKALYRNGVMLTVHDQHEEDAARDAGHADWHEDQAAGSPEEIEQIGADADDVDRAAHLDHQEQVLIETESRLREWDLQLTAREEELSAREVDLAEAVARHEAAQQAAPATTQQPADAGQAEGTADREALKARAKELGIMHAPNIGTDKLAALVAEAQGQ